MVCATRSSTRDPVFRVDVTPKEATFLHTLKVLKGSKSKKFFETTCVDKHIMFKITQNIHLHIGAMESTMMAEIKIIWDKVPASYLGNGSSWDEDATPTMEIMSKQKIRWARNIDVTSVTDRFKDLARIVRKVESTS